MPSPTTDPAPIGNKRVREHLRKIESSETFLSGERQRQLLHFLVKETLAGRGDQLKSKIIACDIFNNPNPAIARVEARRLRQKLTEYYYSEGKSDPIRIKIPKGRYVPTFLPASSPHIQEEEGAGQVLTLLHRVFAGEAPQHWEGTQPILIAENQKLSPFGLSSLMPKTKERLFIAGQNLFGIASGLEPTKLIFDFLKGEGHQIDILLCNLGAKDAVSAWCVVGYEYAEHLYIATCLFKGWIEQAKRRGLQSRLNIRVTKLVTTTMIFSDPERPSGTMVVIPVLPGRPISDERPHFFLSRKVNKASYNHFWTTYKSVFVDVARSRSVLDVVTDDTQCEKHIKAIADQYGGHFWAKVP